MALSGNQVAGFGLYGGIGHPRGDYSGKVEQVIPVVEESAVGGHGVSTQKRKWPHTSRKYYEYYKQRYEDRLQESQSLTLDDQTFDQVTDGVLREIEEDVELLTAERDLLRQKIENKKLRGLLKSKQQKQEEQARKAHVENLIKRAKVAKEVTEFVKAEVRAAELADSTEHVEIIMQLLLQWFRDNPDYLT